ncbi:DNA mismatch repair protein MutT [Pseudomonas fluorescens]|uniref:DNA mismatch repair protein MutT n=1 Tax=Pseudomonas fluorescens TaxID=294 RepID=A0A345V5U2_PSEFL|nr:DNA mismatch repair protein MutT [Pseudomonas fluorescens]
MRRRLASRVLVISSSHRLLLFKIHYRSGHLAGRCYWATPGGKLRSDESFEAAAVRELREETGIEVNSIGHCVARKEFSWQMPDGENVVAVEHYYVAHVNNEQCSVEGWSDREREVVSDVRWWSLSDLSNSHEEILPNELLVLFTKFRKISDSR